MKVSMKNVLIVDNDLGFVYWLAEVLVGAKYQPWPASNAMDAATIIGRRHLAPLGLLVVNPSLRGVSQLIQRLRRNQPDLKVLAVASHNDKVPGVNARLERPNPDDVSAKQKWAREVGRIVSGVRRAA
jgi:DNA-binding NtrC family response regulator